MASHAPSMLAVPALRRLRLVRGAGSVPALGLRRLGRDPALGAIALRGAVPGSRLRRRSLDISWIALGLRLDEAGLRRLRGDQDHGRHFRALRPAFQHGLLEALRSCKRRLPLKARDGGFQRACQWVALQLCLPVVRAFLCRGVPSAFQDQGAGVTLRMLEKTAACT